jgi:hypothetical protein
VTLKETPDRGAALSSETKCNTPADLISAG